MAERDFDLIKQFDNCEFGISLSILDVDTHKIMEPCSSSPEERIVMLQKAKEAGIKTYVFIGPIHPFLSDIKLLMEKVAPYADFIMAEVPNLR